jgi:hypothetical protein
MQPVLPSWFKQRQGKAEPAGENTLRLTAPNLGEAFLQLRADGEGRWSAALRQTADGADVAVTGPDFPSEKDAWEAAFELYRRYVVVGERAFDGAPAPAPAREGL